MKYQLVVQLNTADIETIEAFDSLVALENELALVLAARKCGHIDGHDFGMDEFNIFVHTDAAESALAVIVEFIRHNHPDQTFSVGFRAFGVDRYTSLWPSPSASLHVS